MDSTYIYLANKFVIDFTTFIRTNSLYTRDFSFDTLVLSMEVNPGSLKYGSFTNINPEIRKCI